MKTTRRERLAGSWMVVSALKGPDAARLVVEIPEQNCERRRGSPSAGTCLWDREEERLLDELPDDACWACKHRELRNEIIRSVKDLEEVELP